MRFKIWHLPLLILSSIGLLIGCDKDDDGKIFDDLNINLYSIQRDIELGEYMDSLIKADPVEYPILDPATNAEAYTYLTTMFNDIVASEDLKHGDDFDWELTIIDQDVMNAFAVPGGKLYFYTGIMKYLDNAAGFAGVLAHEIAHSDRRHATQQMTQVSGLSIILSFLTGSEPGQMQEIAQQMVIGLASLSFSRSDEYEADEYSVKYLDETRFHPRGIAHFFEKLEGEDQSGASFEFLSTHPNDENRVDNVDAVWKSLGSPDGGYFEEEWQAFQQTLP
jgi:beta-barrel assembly-enhancing protease